MNKVYYGIIAIICILLLGLYFEFDQMPEGILVSSPKELVQVDYDVLIQELQMQDLGVEGDLHYKYLVIPRDNLGKIFHNKLQEDQPEADIRNITEEKQLKLQFIKFLWFLFFVLILHNMARRIMNSKYRKFRFFINTISFFIICLYMKYQIRIPSRWIPIKLIDLGGWYHNISSYYNERYETRELTQRIINLQENRIGIYLILLILGVFFLLLLSYKINKTRVLKEV